MRRHTHDGTVPAHPLGIPADGRERHSMTPEMARAYRWLVLNRPHAEPFIVSFREVARETGIALSILHRHILGLEERGWIHVVESGRKTARYAFVAPVMVFPGSRA